MALKYEAQLDRKARAWNVVDTTTDQIVGMFGGGANGERQARRSADNHNQQWLEQGLAEYDAGKRSADDNYFQRLHQSDKGIAERERGWGRGDE